MPRRGTAQDFISQAVAKHGNKYNYSLVKYINNRTKVEILCNNCGQIFTQVPERHLTSSGCKKCNNILRFGNNFIDQAKKTHGNKYDYSLVKYINTNIEVSIICKTCTTVFTQVPYNHIRGRGCIKCKRYNNFITRAKNVHGGKFNYNSTVYVNKNTKVNIECNTCGIIFNQNPQDHLRGYGCNKCARSNYSQVCVKWIKEIIAKDNLDIQYMENRGEKTFNLKTWGITSEYVKKYIKLDGYCITNNTAYEFYGCYWHGCPRCHTNRDETTPNGNTHNYNYLKTINRENIIKELGLNLVKIWECEYKLTTI